MKTFSLLILGLRVLHPMIRKVFYLKFGLTLENIYKKQPRKKMVQDPITGEVNVNVKQTKSKKTSKKLSGPDKFRDFRPLDRFESRLLGEKRLSVLLLHYALMIV